MQTLLVKLASLVFLFACAGCRTAHHASCDDFVLGVGQTAFAVRTLKELDAGNTNYAYKLTVLQLKESMLRVQWHLEQKHVAPQDSIVLKGTSRSVLKYLEEQKERFGADPASDHSALQITEVLAQALTDPEDLKRVKVLHDYFAGRFIEEREFYR